MVPRRERRRRADRSAPRRTQGHDQLRRVGVGILAVKLALVPVIFDTGALVAFALPKTIVSEALAAGLATVLIMLGLRDGVRTWIRNPVVAGVVGYFFVYAIASAFALDRYLALFGSHDRLLGLLATADMVITTVALIVVPRAEDLGLLVRAALGGAVIACAYGLLQLVRLDPFAWTQTERVFGTLGNATVFGAYLAVLAAGALAVASRSSLAGRGRAMLAVMAVVFIIAAVASGTRAVLLVAPVLLVLAALVLRRALATTADGARFRVPARPRLVAAGAGLATLIIAVAAMALFGGRVAAFASDPTRIGDDRSIAGRFAIYEVALDAVRDHPLTGIGPDNLEVVFASYRPERYFSVTGITVPDTSAHSWLASLALDAGGLGLLAFGALLVALAIVSVRRPSHIVLVGWSLILAYLAVGIVTVNDVGTLWLFWAGVAAIGLAAVEPVTSVPRQVAGATIAIPIVAIVLWILGALPALAASHSAETANAVAQTSASDRAVSAGRDAVSADGRRAIYWHYLGIADTRQGKFADARDAFLEAFTRAPWNAVYLANAVRAEVALAQAGDKSALTRALDDATRAVAIDPSNPDPQFALALALAANARYEDATKTSERGRALDAAPKDISAYEVAARSYLRLGRSAEAERWASDGLRITGVSGKAAVSIRLTLAQALVNLGRSAEAREQLSLVIAVDPPNAEAARIIAEMNAPRP